MSSPGESSEGELVGNGVGGSAIAGLDHIDLPRLEIEVLERQDLFGATVAGFHPLGVEVLLLAGDVVPDADDGPRELVLHREKLLASFGLDNESAELDATDVAIGVLTVCAFAVVAAGGNRHAGIEEVEAINRLDLGEQASDAEASGRLERGLGRGISLGLLGSFVGDSSGLLEHAVGLLEVFDRLVDLGERVFLGIDERDELGFGHGFGAGHRITP